jgi:ferritin
MLKTILFYCYYYELKDFATFMAVAISKLEVLQKMQKIFSFLSLLTTH